MRKVSISMATAAATGLIVTGCGASTSSNNAQSSPSRSAAAAQLSAHPTVGPTKPGASPTPRPATIDLQVIKRYGEAIVIAPVVISGKTYPFVVDTGATATLIDQSYATKLGLKKLNKPPIKIAGVAGRGSAYLATISDWKLGRSNIPTSTITVSSLDLGPGLVGLLGSDVLSTYGKVTIDYSAQKASLG
jgi:hypothetical protein